MRSAATLVALLLLAACRHPAPSAAAGPGRRDAAAGCYVVMQEQQTAGPALDFLFPAFFALDTGEAPTAAVPGQQVWLPADDLSRRAGSWSWIEDGDSLAVQSTTGREGWRLRFRESPGAWAGHLSAWLGDTLAIWDLNGRRVACPGGLVPAAT
jgi:hypothetical protein